MKTITLILLGAALLSAAPAESTPGGQKEEVLAAMDQYKNAMIHKDGATLERLLSDDLTYTHSGGQVETKAQTVKATATATGTSVIESIEFLPGTTVRIHGNTAFVQGKVDLLHPGKMIHMNVLHVWMKGPSGWQMVARQATLLN